MGMVGSVESIFSIWPALRSVSLSFPKPLTSSTIRIFDSDVQFEPRVQIARNRRTISKTTLGSAVVLSTP